MDDDDDDINNTCFQCSKMICLYCDNDENAYEDVDGHTFCVDCRGSCFFIIMILTLIML